MITFFDCVDGQLRKREGASETVGDATVWVDLLLPTPEEDASLEKQLGIDIPTRAEAREIEDSNRLYTEGGAHYMTALVVYNIDQPIPETSTITFVLVGRRLVTVRYYEPKAIPLFIEKVEKGHAACASGHDIMAGLVEMLISRTADLIERIQDDVDRLAGSLFELKGGQATRTKRLDIILKSTGRQGDSVARAQESAHSIDRLLLFFKDSLRSSEATAGIADRIDTARQDIGALLEHMKFLSTRTAFLLDATLGIISNEQNQVIKLFSVMAVMLMPPTLIASVYGMNFDVMPELRLPFGYPLTLAAMVVSAIVPYIYFRRKGWL